MPNLPGTPSGFVVEVMEDDDPESWQDISDEIFRESVAITWSGDAFTTEMSASLSKFAGGFSWLTEERRIRVYDPYGEGGGGIFDATPYPRYFYGTIKRLSDNAVGNTRHVSFTAMGPHLELTEGSAQIIDSGVFAAGMTDQAIIQALFATYAPHIDTTYVNIIITSCPEMRFLNMSLQEALEEIRKQAGTSTFPAWGAGQSLPVGTLRQPTGANLNGHFYQVTASTGVTGGSEPPWPVVRGATVVDNGVTWQEVGYTAQKPSYYVTWQPDNSLHTAPWGLWLRWFDEASDVQVPIVSTILADVQVEDSTHKRYGAHGRNRDGFSTRNVQTVVGYNGALYTVDGRVTAPATPKNFTAELGTNRLLFTAHGYANGQLLYLATTGVMPAPLEAGKAYYAKEVTTNTLKVAEVAGGETVVLTTVGSGTHSATAPNGYYQPARDSYLFYKSKALHGKIEVRNEPGWDTEKCKLLAEAYARTLGLARQALQAETRHQVTPYIVTGPRKVRYTNTLQGLENSPQYINRATLTFPKMIATYNLDLGARMREMGDDELLGMVGTGVPIGDTVAPPEPTWDETPDQAWVLENYYDERTGTCTVQVECVLFPIPADLDRFLWTWQIEEGRLYQGWTDRSSPRITVPLLPPDADVTFWVKAFDTSQNWSISDPNTLHTVEAAPSVALYNPGMEIVNPNYPTRADGWRPYAAGGGVVSLESSIVHSGAHSLKLDSSSGMGGTVSRATSRLIRGASRLRHRITAWAKGAFADDILTVKVHWYTSEPARTFISTTTLCTDRAVTSSWLQHTFDAYAPAGTGSFKVEFENGQEGSTSLYIDDVEALVNPATTRFYNGSFEIPGPDPRYPDGWTFEGDATSGTASDNVRDGAVSFTINQQTGETLTTAATPLVAIPGAPYVVAYSIMWDEDTITGTAFQLRWRDASGDEITTDLVANELGDAQLTFLDREYGPFIAPPLSASVELLMYQNVHLGVTPIVTTIDAVDVRRDLSGGIVEITEQDSAPDTPLTGKGRVYIKSADKKLYYKDADGTEVLISGGGTVTNVTGVAPISSSGGATPAISIAAATTSARGAVELATDGENAANVAVQGNDARLNTSTNANARVAVRVNSGGTPSVRRRINIIGASPITAAQVDDAINEEVDVSLSHATSGVSAGDYLIPNITLNNTGHVTVATSRAGTSFPGSPASGDFFYRTDLGVLCRYDGTRWLGPEYDKPFTDFDGGAPPYTVNGANIKIMPIADDYALYLTRFYVSALVGPTNNGLNYWNFDLHLVGADTVIASVNTSASAADTWTQLPEDTTFSTNPIAITDDILYVQVTKTGAPGVLYPALGLKVRNIYT